MEKASLTPDQLFHKCRPLESADIAKSHYIRNAFTQGLKNYRILSLNELFTLNLFHSLPRFLLRFINDKGEVIVVANLLGDCAISLVIRDISSRDFITYGHSHIPYGVGSLLPFTFGDWLLLTEGVLDRDSLLPYYPYTLALLSAGLSVIQTEIVEVLTDRVVLAYDNDPTGHDAYQRDFKRLSKKGIIVSRLHHPSHIKDPGTLSELLHHNQHSSHAKLRAHYLQQLQPYL